MNYGEAKASSHGLSSPGEPGFLGLVPGSKPRFTSTFWAFACLILANAPLTKSHDQIQMTEVKYMLVLDGRSLRVILKSKRLYTELGFPGGSDDKESICSAAALGSIPRVGRSPGGGHGSPLQYSCLENPMDRGAWWLQSMGSQRVGHDRATKRTRIHTVGRSSVGHLCS